MSRPRSSARRPYPALRVESLENRSVPAVLPPVAVGQAAIAGASHAIRYADFVYVAGTNGISVFNVAGTNINNPQLVRTIGSKADLLEVHGNLLVAVRGGLNPNSTKLDTYSLADPANPQIVRTQKLGEASRGIGRAQAVALGDGRFAYGNQGAAATDPGLFVVDTNDPSNFATVGLDVPAEALHVTDGNNLLYAADGSKLIIYSVPPRTMAPATEDRTLLVGVPQFTVGSDAGGGTATCTTPTSRRDSP